MQYLFHIFVEVLRFLVLQRFLSLVDRLKPFLLPFKFRLELLKCFFLILVVPSPVSFEIAEQSKDQGEDYGPDPFVAFGKIEL